MSTEFTEIQFCASTAEDEANYFTGELPREVLIAPTSVMPQGVYRVVDGEVFRVVGTPLPGQR